MIMSDNLIAEQLQNTIKQLKCENESLKYEYNQLKCENESLYIIIKELESKLILYDNPHHTPPSLKRDESLKKSPNDNNNGKPGRKNGHKGETRPVATPTEFIDLTEEKCPYCES